MRFLPCLCCGSNNDRGNKKKGNVKELSVCVVCERVLLLQKKKSARVDLWSKRVVSGFFLRKGFMTAKKNTKKGFLLPKESLKNLKEL